MKYIWDKNIAEGGFRYITSIEDGNGLSELETMYGLFIGTMLRCSKYFSDIELKNEILDKCKKHTDNVFLTDYGVKHSMIPHNLSAGGKKSSKSNDSQLGYAVLQFPYGMQLLSLMTDNDIYRERCFQIIDTLIARHEIGDNINSPKGYVNILETSPPFGFENDYYSPTWCYEFMFLPSYLLYASVQPSEGVQINWKDDNEPNVYWLCGGMPYWDLKNVKFDYLKKLFFCEVTSENNNGTIKFEDLGFKGIKDVKCDKKPYFEFDENTLELLQGKHFYEIIFL